MYEIWLTLNIVWESILTVWPLVLFVALAWAALMLAALSRRGANWSAAFAPAALVAVVVAVVAVFLIPGLTKSSLADLSYWVDWANVIAIALGVGAAAAAFAWPLGALMKPRRHA